MKNVNVIAFCCAFLVMTLAPTAAAQEFYQGKTLQIVVGFAAGGGFDTYSRAIARHMGRHILGNPAIVVVNMPGAGSLIAANHVFNRAKPDGLTIGNFVGHLVLSQIVGRPGVEFDARRFRWIGIPVTEHGACALTTASGITSLERWQAAKEPVKLGASGVGNVDYNTAKALKDVLGLPVQVIQGYKGTSEVRLAAESGEVAGSCWQWEAIKPTWRQALDTGKVRIVLQLGAKAHPDLPNVPLARSLARSEEARLLLKAAIEDPNLFTIAYAVPPGTPDDRAQVLRKAFAETLKDPRFLEDAKKSSLDIDPMTGEEMEKIVQETFNMDPSLVEKLRSLVLK